MRYRSFRLSGQLTRLAALGIGVVLLASACGTTPGARGPDSSRFLVVAAENFWGSIAAQLAGNRATVESIIVNPDTDPHAYEPTAADARTLAVSRMAIVNGIGYDNWASQLLAADATGQRRVLDVGTVLGLVDGDNPHQWYSPGSVTRIVAAIVADYDSIEPSGRAYFAARERHFERVSLARYDALRAQIRARFAGVAVGYSESIFQPLGASLGLRLATPYSFAKSVAEGTDVSAQDEETVERQATHRLIKVWVYNSQNVTPVVEQVTALARAHRIPIVTITETLTPEHDSFEEWQVAELKRLLAALELATRT